MSQQKDLEYVYAEIDQHLSNVLADETIKTIIQMLKDYPRLKEELEASKKQSKSFYHEIKELESKLQTTKFHKDNFKEKQDHIIKLLQGKTLTNPNDDYLVHAGIRSILKEK